MGIIYKVTPKKLLEARNEIFIKKGIPALKMNGFEKAPFPESLFGRNNLKDFTYELCRLDAKSVLDFVTVHISRGDRYIKVFLNVFKLHPDLESLEQLNSVDGMQFRLPPNSRTKMRLRSDDFKGMPLFNTVKHKVRPFFTPRGFQRRIDALGKLIGNDLSKINFSRKRWLELHEPMNTDWQGREIRG